MTKSSDDEIVAKLDAGDRANGWMALVLLGLPVVLAVLFAAAFFTGHTALLESDGAQIAIGVLFAMAILLSFIRFRRHFRSEAYLESLEPRILRRRIDRFQRTWRWVLATLIGSSCLTIISTSYALGRSGPNNRPLTLLVAGGFVFVIALFSAMVFSGLGWHDRDIYRILNDDFIRALRARAARLGYVTLMAAVASALLIATWRPDLTLRVLAWALYAGFAVPALYYIIADWRASRDG
jgi:magnesium-transporting ATPase (P-type)